MKRIKLFENFNTNNLLDIKTDIESILYNIDDLGYDIRFEFYAKGFNSIPCEDLESLLSTYNTSIKSRKRPEESFLIVLRLPDKLDLSGDKNIQYHYIKMKRKLEWFLVLLKEHLDYIDEENFSIKDGGTSAWIIVKL